MKWYVVHTTPRWEKKVSQNLTNAGIENYCPLNKVRRKWSDRYKVIEEPLFRGYVFVKLEPEKKWEATRFPGIINFLHHDKKPAIVKDDEIITIKKFLSEFEEVSVVDKTIQEGMEVEILSGVLLNHKGILLEKNGNYAKIKINSLGIQLIGTFKMSNIKPVFNPRL